MNLRTLSFFLGALSLSISFAGPARGDGAGADAQRPQASERSEAADRFDRALRLVNAGDLLGGLAEFQRAYAIQPSAVVLYNVGLVNAALNRPVEAAHALEKVLAAPDALKPENAQRARDVLREQADKIGQLEVTTNVRDGVVEIDNVEAAKLPLTGPLDVASGPHVVGIIAPGFAPARREILVAGRERAESHLELVAIEGLLAHIAVACRVPAADVFVDGERIGKTPLEATITVAPGAHQVEVRRAGYTPATKSITLQDGARGELTLNPVVDRASLAREGGWLGVTTSETLSVLTVDGDEVGLLTGPILLPAGAHRLHIERGGFLPAERDTVVPVGRTASVSIVFEPTPETRANYVSGAQGRRTLSWVFLGVGAGLAAGGVAFALVEQGQLADARSSLGAVAADQTRFGGGSCDPANQLSDAQAAACNARLNDANEKVNNLITGRTVGWIAAGVGGAALVTGAVLLFTGDNPHRYDERPPEPEPIGWRVVPVVGPRGFSLSAAAAF